MVMVNCAVSQCKSCNGRSAEGEKISFHKFPMTKKLRLKWEKQIGRKNLKYSIQSIKTARLCSLHFTDDCYSVNRSTATSMGHTLTRWKLKDDAVPTLFDNEPCAGSVDNVKAETTTPGKMMDEVMSTQDCEMKVDKSLINDIKPQIEKNVNDTTFRPETNGKIMLKGQTYSHTSKASLENKSTSSCNGVTESEAEEVPVANEKDLNSVKFEKESDSLTDDAASKSRVKSPKDTCSVVFADSGNHGVTPCHKLQCSIDCLSKDLSSEEFHLSESSHSKEFPLEERDISKKDYLFLCEICGIHFSDEVYFSNHLASCNLKDIKISNVKTSTVRSQTESNEKNNQKERVAEASSVMQVSLSDYEKRFASTFFVCACGFTANSSVELVAHSSSHTMEEKLVCSVCSSVYESILLLQQHVHKSKHYWTLEGKLPSPNLVWKPEPRSTSIPAPVVVSQPTLNSQACDYSSDGKVGAMDLTINGLEHVGVPLKCDYCPFSSFSARDLLNHRKVHTPSIGKKPENEPGQSDGLDAKLNGFAKGQGLLKCDSCGYSTKSAIELLQHKTYHSSEGPFKCNTCSYATISAIDLLQHKKDQSCLSKQC